jgi:hypothetical protein
VEQLTVPHSAGRLLGMLVNSRLGLKYLPTTNTLAYLAGVLVRKKKSLMVCGTLKKEEKGQKKINNLKLFSFEIAKSHQIRVKRFVLVLRAVYTYVSNHS